MGGEGVEFAHGGLVAAAVAADHHGRAGALRGRWGHAWSLPSSGCPGRRRRPGPVPAGHGLRPAAGAAIIGPAPGLVSTGRRRKASQGRLFPGPLTTFPGATRLRAMFTLGRTGDIHGFDPLVLLLMALLAEAYLGDMGLLFRFVKHPVAVIGGWIDVLDRKLNRENRGQMDRAVRGAIAVTVVVVPCAAIGWAIAWLSLNHTFGWMLELFVVITLMAQRGLYDHVRAVAVGLSNSLEDGRQAVAHIVGRDPQHLDTHGVARAAIESCAENFGDGVVGPVFWYLLFGLPGLLVYKAVNTLDSMIGHRTPRHRAFGLVAARLDDVLNLVPARLAGLYLALAALFVPTARPGRAVAVMLRDAGKHRSVNAGWPEGAMAGALDLALAGPRRYAQGVVKDAWIGDGSARAGVTDIRRALYLYVVACLLNALVVAAVVVVRMGMDG
ncbi:MAG: cobalamin biosynthesis protein CobD [Hyphomicrobiales bacterium]|nr:cobalamin biosynthesis protein CobD [Hyphomicrobiales bacterium]MCP5370098.1 cobalamin biosynthesis protein CobD [Hyphomicrobiales bacterium]